MPRGTATDLTGSPSLRANRGRLGGRILLGRRTPLAVPDQTREGCWTCSDGWGDNADQSA